MNRKCPQSLCAREFTNAEVSVGSDTPQAQLDSDGQKSMDHGAPEASAQSNTAWLSVFLPCQAAA